MNRPQPDVWGNTYRIQSRDNEAQIPQVYSTVEDCVSHSDGTDPADIRSWDEEPCSRYSRRRDAHDSKAILFAADRTTAFKSFRTRKGNLNLSYPANIEPQSLMRFNEIRHSDRTKVTYSLLRAAANLMMSMLTVPQVSELLQSFIKKHLQRQLHGTLRLRSDVASLRFDRLRGRSYTPKENGNCLRVQ